ncbi:MAG: hypothetical protein IT423_15665 [Pirellulaceae bacterium]|nr:hypothetical protein [Pirellulaceae bacterium]
MINQDKSVSGRWLTVVTLTVCVSLVIYALWQRSVGTQHIRQLWGAEQARLIQHAQQVTLYHEGRLAPADGQDLSTAPGLVHLRATLVDDRYFHWPSQRYRNPSAPVPNGDHFVVRFAADQMQIDVGIDLSTGMVTNLATSQSVQLIDSSRQAVAAYLKATTAGGQTVER